MKAEQAKDVIDKILRNAGATVIHRHGSGSGDIDIVINYENKAALRRQLRAEFRQALTLQHLPATLHIYHPKLKLKG